ncbi:MAG: cytochrome c oxidase subunit [Thermoleophilaceae bacterium]|jgi:cytochrome c oxidase subunit 1|nr:cytochrome c oxidase subunit [Thermoleophilaceae bacterium]
MIALRRLAGFNVVTGVVLAIGGFLLGRWIGDSIASPSSSTFSYVAETGQNDLGLVVGYLVAFVGFMAGIGALNYPVRRLLGHPPTLPERPAEGIGRYFRYTTDHKVVGMQYLVGVGLFFLIAGVNAMLIRLALLSPSDSLVPPDRYLQAVGLHGSMMMGTMTSAVLGPFANYFVPLLIGARRSAFPRLEALSFWVICAAEVILLTSVSLGGFQTGWTGYAPLSEQGAWGIDAYLCFFVLVGVSMTLLGFNIAATVITMRAPDMNWGRLPIFVWGVFTTAIMMVLAAPVLSTSLVLALLDRTVGTSFFLTSQGGSAYLYENLFWFFGHPEVYLLALPGMGILLQLLPVFTRKPLWGYGVAVAGMIGIALLSFTVWQHHLFMSGINSDLRAFTVLSTELISIPTGLIFLSAIGTLWRGRIRLTVPMLFCLAWVFNFLIGGVTGIYLSDAPTNTTDHGSFFVLAHFHYTIMGGLVFTFFAAIYYWVPKMTGLMLSQPWGKVHFWLMFLGFNGTFLPLFIAGLQGMPRRVVTYPDNLRFLNEFSSISAFLLGFSMLVFLANAVYSLLIARTPADDNPWAANSLEWQTTSPPPMHNFHGEVPEIGHPHDYGVPVPEAGAS